MAPRILAKLFVAISALLVAACSGSTHSASFSLPGTDLVLVALLEQTNAPLAEYNRWLVLKAGSNDLQKVELFPDTGGYTIVNLYQLNSGDFLVRAMGNHRYVVSVGSRSISSSLTGSKSEPPPGASFVGAFDFAPGYAWQFFGAAERPERDCERLYPDR